jgi:hypothetical protein
MMFNNKNYNQYWIIILKKEVDGWRHSCNDLELISNKVLEFQEFISQMYDNSETTAE